MSTKSHIIQLPTSNPLSKLASDVRLSSKNIVTNWIHKLEYALNVNNVS
jgi:hypothetical protein